MRNCWSCHQPNEAVPLSDEVRDELDRRLASDRADPSTARPWDEIKAELFGTK